MNPEQPSPAPLPNGPLPRLGDSPTPKPTETATSPKSGGEIGKHLKAAFIYLGVIFIICASAAITGEVAVVAAFYAYWGALGIHALTAIYLAGKSALSGDWAALGRHVVAVLLVAAIAAGACWANLMALGMGGGLGFF
jgi:hypothetical protein